MLYSTTYLVLQSVTTLFRQVAEVKHSGSQVSESSHRLHFYNVSLFQRVIQYSRRVYHLPSQVFIIGMSHVQRFRCECIRLNLYISSSNL